MDGSGLSSSDVLALAKDNDGNFNNNGFMWIVLFIVLAMNGGAWGGNRGPVIMQNPNPPAPAPQPGVTQAELTAGLNNNAIQNQLQSLQLATANNDLETVKAIQNQTNDLLQRDYANNINLLQGYNEINQSVNNQTAQLGSKIDNLGYKMEQCCCSIKTQMLQDRNADLQNALNQQVTINSNLQQTQQIVGQILGNAGRFVAWAPSGSADATKVVATAG